VTSILLLVIYLIFIIVAFAAVVWAVKAFFPGLDARVYTLLQFLAVLAILIILVWFILNGTPSGWPGGHCRGRLC